MAGSHTTLALVVALVVLTISHAQQQAPVVSFLAPQERVTALETLGPNSAAAHPVGRTPLERGVPSWGAYLTAPDAENAALPGPTTGSAVLYLNGPDTLAYNITLNRGFDPADQLQSILLTVPQFINTTALTLGFLYGANATTHPQVTQQPGVNGSVNIMGTTTTAPGIAFTTLIWNLSSGHAILNLYSANYPQPDEPMGCCNNAEVRSNGFLEPLNAPALPLGGLRQDHHGYETMPVSPANSIPFHATLMPLVNSTAGGLISLLVAPDNSSIAYNVTLGGLAPGNEIYNVSVWFGTGAGRVLGWYPYSLYSFASSRLPTPRGGLLAPVNGANFTLATGWVGKFIDNGQGGTDASSAGFFADPTYDFGLAQLAMGNVYIVIGTANYPNGELQGHAVLGWAAA